MDGGGVARFPIFAGAQRDCPILHRGRDVEREILPPPTSCVGFGFFLPSSSPSLVREKKQVEAQPSALLCLSDPTAWLSSAQVYWGGEAKFW